MSDQMPADLQALVDRTNVHFEACGFGPVVEEQVECVMDCERTDEALDMLDDWVSRLGLADDLFGDLCGWVEDNRVVDDERRSNDPRR